MLESLSQCPLCKNRDFISLKPIIDYAVSKEQFQIVECPSCSLLFTNPRPSAKDISPYYEFDEYYSHSDDKGGLIPTIYQKVKKYSIKKKIQQLNQYHLNGTLLDYGCGTGELIAHANHEGWDVYGIEPNQKAGKLAQSKLPNRIFSSLTELPKACKFDIITLYHVLEHIHDLHETIAHLLDQLKPKGYLFIAVPNPESPDAQHYKDHWAGWDVPRHLYHFTYKAMQTLGEKYDLEYLESKPLKFDSFYVSLLSEGYINPNQATFKKFIKAFNNGLNSNIVASKSSNPAYSSNIYIFRKP